MSGTVRTNEELLDERVADMGEAGGKLGGKLGGGLLGKLGGASGGRKGAQLGTKLLKLDVQERSVPAPGGGEAAVREALLALGDEQPPGDPSWPLRVFKSGGLSNPVVVEARLAGDAVHLRASAREGLIKQKTAAKALDEIERALGA